MPSVVGKTIFETLFFPKNYQSKWTSVQKMHRSKTSREKSDVFMIFCDREALF